MNSLIQYSPFHSDLEKWFDDFFTGFSSYPSIHQVPINCYQKDDELVVEVYAPNLSIEQLKVTVTDGVLKVEGESIKEEKVENKQFYRREMHAGSFVRTVVLPSDVVEDKAEAKYKDGVLKIMIPKVESKKPKQVKISE